MCWSGGSGRWPGRWTRRWADQGPSMSAPARSALPRVGARPQCPQGSGYPGGLDAVGRIEVVALRVDLEGEVREHALQSLRHAGVVVGMAAATQREVDRP